MKKITINSLPNAFKTLSIAFHTASSYYEQSTMKRSDGVQDFYQILFILDGSGILHCQNKSYALKKGCAFFIAENVASEYINTGGLVSAFLSVKGDAICSLTEYFNNSDFIFYEFVHLQKYIYKIDEIIKEYLENKREATLSALCYSFFVDFFEEQNDNIPSLKKVSRYIEKNFTQKLTLNELASINASSVSKLCHDFKNSFGCTIFEYILNLRLSHAKDFIYHNKDVRCKDIANLFGFEDVSYFCKAYKKSLAYRP